jgi:hypothetical protein
MESEFKDGDAVALRRYLLGELAESELGSVEERLFSSEHFWEHLCLIEDDLIDSYVRGELRGVERAHFESHFLSSPRRCERVAMARTWLGRGTTSAPQWAAAFRPLFITLVRTAWNFAPAAAILVAMIGGAVLIGFNVRLARQQDETAMLRRQVRDLASGASAKRSAPETGPNPGLLAQIRKDLQRDLRSLVDQASKTQAPLSLVLAPGAQRGAGQSAQQIVIAPGSQSVQLILELTDSAPYASYRVVMQTPEGTEVWGSDQLTVFRALGGNSLRLIVPSRVLREGDYRLLLSGLNDGRPAEELADYYVFHVAAP